MKNRLFITFDFCVEFLCLLFVVLILLICVPFIYPVWLFTGINIWDYIIDKYVYDV